jgi:hypothetical protein
MSEYQRRYRTGPKAGQLEMFPNFPVKGKLPTYIGDEVTHSSGHDYLNLSTIRDEGGSFYNRKHRGVKKRQHVYVKNDYPITPQPATYDRAFWTERSAVECPIETIGSGSNRKPAWPTSLESSDSELNTYGTRAIEVCKPTSGGAQLSTALGELIHDGLPSIIGVNTWRDRLSKASSAGDEYLNVEFGWKPLISDITSVMSSIQSSHDLMTQYERDMGRPVRRSYTFPEIKTETTILLGNRPPDAPADGDTNQGVIPPSTMGAWYRTERTSIKRWFSGAFMYGPPLQNESVQSTYTLRQKADHILGLDLTPDVLWNLTPWSWAVDWVSNGGSVLSFTSDAMTHGLVLRYGYTMEHTVHEYEYNLVGAIYRGNSLPNLTAKLVTETKKRVRANPYGFGLTWDGLTSYQAAILAALGISRT